MNESIDRIAEILLEHHWYFVGNLGVPGMPDSRGYKCNCGGWSGDDPRRHVAAAVVAMLREAGVDL